MVLRREGVEFKELSRRYYRYQGNEGENRRDRGKNMIAVVKDGLKAKPYRDFQENADEDQVASFMKYPTNAKMTEGS